MSSSSINSTFLSTSINRASVRLETFFEVQAEVLELCNFISNEPKIIKTKEVQWEKIKKIFPEANEDDFQIIWNSLRRLGVEEKEDTSEDGKILVELALKRTESYGDSYKNIVLAGQKPHTSKARLLSSLLIMLVSDFEVFIADLLGILYNEYPNLIQDKEYKVSTIFNTSNLEELKAEVIDKAIMNKIQSESYPSYLSQLMNKDIKTDIIISSCNAIEIFQRRHLIIHNNSKVSSRYQQVMKAVCKENCTIPNIDQKLEIDEQYLIEAADKLTAIALLVCNRLVARLSQSKSIGIAVDSKNYYYRMCNYSFHLLLAKRYNLVILFENTFTKASLIPLEALSLVKVNKWLAHRELGEISSCYEEISTWDHPDDKIYKLAKIILLNDIGTPKVNSLIQNLIEKGQISNLELTFWPLYKGYSVENSNL